MCGVADARDPPGPAGSRGMELLAQSWGIDLAQPVGACMPEPGAANALGGERGPVCVVGDEEAFMLTLLAHAADGEHDECLTVVDCGSSTAASRRAGAGPGARSVTFDEDAVQGARERTATSAARSSLGRRGRGGREPGPARAHAGDSREDDVSSTATACSEEVDAGHPWRSTTPTTFASRLKARQRGALLEQNMRLNGIEGRMWPLTAHQTRLQIPSPAPLRNQHRRASPPAGRRPPPEPVAHGEGARKLRGTEHGPQPGGTVDGVGDGGTAALSSDPLRNHVQRQGGARCSTEHEVPQDLENSTSPRRQRAHDLDGASLSHQIHGKEALNEHAEDLLKELRTIRFSPRRTRSPHRHALFKTLKPVRALCSGSCECEKQLARGAPREVGPRVA